MDILVLLIVLLLGFQIKNGFKNLSPWDKKNLNYLWLYHLFFGVVFWAYIKYGPGGDANGYWAVPHELSLNRLLLLFNRAGVGTFGLYLLNYFPVHLFRLSFFGLSMIYAFLGYTGITFFYVFFKNNIRYNSTLWGYAIFPLCFFLPNFNFWSAGVGKDTLCFLSIALFFYGMQKPFKNLVKIGMAMGLTYMVRPHITIFLIAAMGGAFLMEGKLKTYQKVFFMGVFLVAFALLFDNILAFLKLDSVSAESIEQFGADKTALLNRHSGSGVDISSYPYPLKVATFLYRPFFFDINGALAIVASFENLILLILSVRFIKLNPFKLFKRGNYLFKAFLIFFCFGAAAFPLILSNLGIMLRQKNMFLPALFFVCLWAFSYQKETQKKRVTASVQ